MSFFTNLLKYKVARTHTDPTTGLVSLVGAGGAKVKLQDFGHRNGLQPTLYNNLMSGEVIDFASASFVHVGGSGSSIDTNARNAYGGYTATLNIGSTANDYTRIRTYALGNLANMDVDGSPFVVVVEIESGMSDNDTVNLTFSTDPATNGLSYTWSLRKAYHIGNLYYFTAPSADFSASGGLDWTATLTYMHVQVKAVSAGGGVVKVHGVFRRQIARPKLIIDFDDADATVYTQVYPYMAKYGLVGNVCVIADLVGTAGYCTEAQLDEMYDAGWDMLVHGEYAHTSLNTYAAIYADVLHNKEYIEARWPRGIEHYVFPTGTVDEFSEQVLQDLGFKTSRVTVYSAQVTAPWGVDSPLSLYGRGINETNKATLLTSLDSAILSGATCRHFGHVVPFTVATASTDIAIADWRTYVDGVADRVRDGKVDCVTLTQWAQFMGLE